MILDNWSVPGVLFTEYLGHVDGQALIDYSLKKSGDPRFDTLQLIVGDWSRVDQTSISPSQIQELICCLQAASRQCPDAINVSIVRRNETGTALVAWYNHLAEKLPWKIEIFHDTEAALSAHGLSDAQFERHTDSSE